MENDKDLQDVLQALYSEGLQAFFSALVHQLHVHNTADLLKISRSDLHHIGIVSRLDIHKFEKIRNYLKPHGLRKQIAKLVKSKSRDFDASDPLSCLIMHVAFIRDPVVISLSEIDIGSVIGSGHCGNVMKGDWKRTIADGVQVRVPVAIKKLMAEESDHSWKKEVAIFTSLNQIHPSIIKFYGLLVGEQISVVTEFAEHGSLLQQLQRKLIQSVATLSQFAVQIASGMVYLQSRNLVHRDLAARNILVTAPNQVKISDFGLSKILGDEKKWKMDKTEMLPIRWLAPECVKEGVFTSASDVWSFAVVLWEMYTFGDTPWSEYNNEELLHKMLTNSDEPEDCVIREPQLCPQDFYANVIVKCMNRDPDQRPSFQIIRDELLLIQPQTVVALKNHTDSQQLMFQKDDFITCIKSVGNNPNEWLGQHERTQLIGTFSRDHTGPINFTIGYRSGLLSPTKTSFTSSSRVEASPGSSRDTVEMTIQEGNLPVLPDEATRRSSLAFEIGDAGNPSSNMGNVQAAIGSHYPTQVSPKRKLGSFYVSMTGGHEKVTSSNPELTDAVEYVNARSSFGAPDEEQMYQVPRPTALSSVSKSHSFPMLSLDDDTTLRVGEGMLSQLSISPESRSTPEYAMSPATTPDSECALSSSSENLAASSGSDGSMTRRRGPRSKTPSKPPRRFSSETSPVNMYENDVHPADSKQSGYRAAVLSNKYDIDVKLRPVPANLSPKLMQVVNDRISTNWNSFLRDQEAHSVVGTTAADSSAAAGSILKPIDVSPPVLQPLHRLVKDHDPYKAEAKADDEDRIYEEIGDSSLRRTEDSDMASSFRPRPRPKTLDLGSSQAKPSPPIVIPGQAPCPPPLRSPKEEMLQKQAEFVKFHHMMHAQHLNQDRDFPRYEQAWDGRPVFVRRETGGAAPSKGGLSPTDELSQHGIKNQQYLAQFSSVIPTKPVEPEPASRMQRAMSLQELRVHSSLNELKPCFERDRETSAFERGRGKKVSVDETKPSSNVAVRDSLRLREPQSKDQRYNRRKPASGETRKVMSKKERLQIEASDYHRNNWDRFDECMRSKRVEKDRTKRPAKEIGWPMDLQSMSRSKQKQLTDMIEEIRKMVPDATPAECLEGLRYSADRPDDAARHVLVKRLVNCKYGFAFEQCERALADCHWNFDEAKRSLKAQYLCDRFRELDHGQCRAVLMETDWNLVASVKKIYVQNCQAIGIDPNRGSAILMECGNNVTRAIETMKITRVAEITGRPEQECFKTLTHCHWNVERAVNFMFSES